MGLEPVNTGVASGESAQLHVYHMGIGEKCQEMRQITKDIQINIDGSQTGFRLTKLDPQPVMTGPEWGYPELEHDTPSCLKLLLEGISWSLSGFFGEGQPGSPPAPADISP